MYLNLHSYYSLRYGTLSVDELTDLAVAAKAETIALTDINNSTGILEFVKSCLAKGLKPVAGIEFRKDNRLLYIAIARNNEGYREINELLTRHNVDGEELPLTPSFENAFVVYPFGSRTVNTLAENEFIGIMITDINKIILRPESEQRKYVIQHPVTFKDKDGYELHRQLRAVDENILISEVTTSISGSPEEVFHSVPKLRKAFERLPIVIRNTEKLISECSFQFEFAGTKNKKTFTGNRYDDRLLLEKLAIDGMRYRYGGNNAEAKKRIASELEIIDRLGFSSYFLITWDVIRYSLSRGFYHVGRGSGANSIVAYCLKITDVCPIELDLYFERFLNPKRKSPPDFDIDYSWKERDEVIDYIFKRYGKKHTALLGAMSTFRDRSIVRELGKVNGLPKAEIDMLIEQPQNLLSRNKITRDILRFDQMMRDFPNLRSIHAGGVLISELPISCYTALDMPPKGFPTTQFDMYLAEDIGFEKLDILSQRGIGHIKEAAEIIYRNRGIKVDVHEVEKFKKDERVKQQIKAGDTIGCFYVESPAMRGLLKKLRCDSYLTLVAASSIIRPGVASSGMMKEYINRFYHPDKFTYLHPIMEQQLKETYGVMVYQEDVLKVCHHFAGLDLADADVLRRMMSGKGKKRKDLELITQKFFSNCKAYGYSDSLTKEVWRQIESFAGYSFSKAHSASYAVESYQSLYLKTYFPQDFMVAVINNFGGFYSTWVYVNEAQKAGASIHLPCINHGEYKTAIHGSDVYLGFIHVGALESTLAQSIETERHRNGDYKGLEDFIIRTRASLEYVVLLVRIGAFRFTGKTKKELLWEAHLLLAEKTNKKPVDSLFEVERKQYNLPKLDYNIIEDAYDELEILGFTVSLSMFDLLQTAYRGDILARDLHSRIGDKVRIIGNHVTTKYVRTKRGETMYFANFLDTEGNFIDTVHFPDSLKRYRLQGRGVYLIEGKVVEEFGYASIEVEKVAKLKVKPDPRSI